MQPESSTQQNPATSQNHRPFRSRIHHSGLFEKRILPNGLPMGKRIYGRPFLKRKAAVNQRRLLGLPGVQQ